MNECHHIDVSLREPRLEQLRSDRLAPLNLKFLCIVAAAFGDIIPFIRKSTRHAGEYFALHKIAKRTFHHSPSGGSGNKDRLLCRDQLLKTRLHGSIEFFEIIATMSDHWATKCLKGFLGDLHGSRTEEFDV